MYLFLDEIKQAIMAFPQQKVGDKSVSTKELQQKTMRVAIERESRQGICLKAPEDNGGQDRSGIHHAHQQTIEHHCEAVEAPVHRPT